MNLGFPATYVALWVLVVFDGLLILALLQRLEKLRQLIDHGGLAKGRLPVGTAAPEFSGVDQFGQQVGLGNLDGRGGVILFLSPDCIACKALVDSIGSLADELPLTIALCRGEKEACAAFSTGLGPAIQLLPDPSGETAALYGASAFPTSVAIDRNLKIRNYGHPKAIEDLKRTFADSLARDGRVITGPELSMTSSNSKQPLD